PPFSVHYAKEGISMHIERFTLKNYRNYANLDVSFDDKINVIIGENAQGKTNLMEAMYVLAFTKAYRTPRDKELIQWEKYHAKSKLNIKKQDQTYRMDTIKMRKGKNDKLNRL